MKKHWLLLPIAASTCVMPLVSCKEQPTTPQYDYDNLLNSYRKMLLETIDTTAYKEKTAQEIINTELTEQEITKFSKPYDSYYFKDIDYDDPNPSLWPAHQHIVRTLQIAILGYQKNDAELMDLANKLTIYWLGNEFHNPNWWFNQIGVPRDFSNLAIFVINNLDSELRSSMIEWIRHGSLKYNPETLDETGTNMFWAGDITLKAGLLVHDDDEINLMFEKVGSEIALDKNEGFQSDGTYYQHGHQLYTGGYGRQGALLLAKIAAAFVDSDIQLGESKLQIIINFVLDGLKYFTHKTNFNWQCMGRTYTRKQAAQFDGGTTDLGNIDELRYFAQLPNCPRKDELNELLDHWKRGEPSFNGVKYFPKSAFLASCIDGIYIGFKGTDKDLINCEIANNENMLAHNLIYGVNVCAMEDGNEYADISPLWNYCDIPGTSTYIEEDIDLIKYDNEDFKRTKNGTFYGGYNTQEQVGYVSQSSWHTLVWPSVTEYRIIGFATPWGLAVLGNNINNNEHNLTTTIQQCLKGNKEPSYLPDNKGVMHGNIVYSNIEDNANSKLGFVVEERTRSWSRNNSSYADTDKQTGTVLTIKIDNEDDTKYAYAIQPKTKYEQANHFEVARNDDLAQAILLPDGKIAALFYRDGEFTYNGVKCFGGKGEFGIFPKP